jgi:hypothetical protein
MHRGLVQVVVLVAGVVQQRPNDVLGEQLRHLVAWEPAQTGNFLSVMQNTSRADISQQ